MGNQERKAREKEIRRTDILDAAERLFFRDGYAAATMDHVAKEADFSKRTVYVYFNSKEQILFEIMMRGYKLLIAEVEAGLADATPRNALDTIRRIGNTIYTFSIAHPDYFKAIVDYENSELDFNSPIPDQSREECYALGERLSEFLSGALTAGIAEGVIRKDLDVAGTTLILWACIIGVFGTVRKKEEYIKNVHQRDSQKLVFEAFELLIKSIASTKGEVRA
ncbi:TetR/AcrR family transcriptional regulator [Paenibacillus sp. sgz500958]|uniref:TetR/AcrR family transcriptional regulator n=1 Tax=Paenibacillus sp. sgz500958 TaxID=3242475 RepID=UPI0036D43BDA